MLVSNNYQNNLYNRNNNLYKISFKKAKPIELTRELMNALPTEVQARLRAEMASGVDTIPQVSDLLSQGAPSGQIPQEISVIVSNIERLLREAGAELSKLKKMCTGAEEIAPVESKPTPKALLTEVLQYTSKRNDAFHKALDSEECSIEDVKLILDNIARIRKDHRVFLVEKMINFALKTKDKNLLKLIYDNVKINLPAEHIPSTINQISSTSMQISYYVLLNRMHYDYRRTYSKLMEDESIRARAVELAKTPQSFADEEEKKAYLNFVECLLTENNPLMNQKLSRKKLPAARQESKEIVINYINTALNPERPNIAMVTSHLHSLYEIGYNTRLAKIIDDVAKTKD